MSCGCRTNDVDFTATRAAMCQTCPAATRNDRGSAIACTISAKSIIAVADASGACPLNRHPDAAGRVRWLGLDWLGVPEPIRWRLVWALGREPRGLIGCGCVAALKASAVGPIIEPWLEGVGLLRRRLAEAMSDWTDAMA